MKTDFRIPTTGAFGMPIAENPSGVMCEAGYRSLGLEWRYQLFEVQPQDLEKALEGVRAMQFKGLNLTIPHKIAALPYMDELTESAGVIGAINTVLITEDGKLIGENTDGKGFVLGMESNGINLSGKRIVILGAGGAARAISVECAFAGCEEVIVAARKESAGTELSSLITTKTKSKSKYLPWTPKLQIPVCDILINATNIGLYPDANKPDIDYGTVTKGMIVQDIIPNPARTPFLIEAEKCGARVFDGMQMLVNQGALGVKLWTGREPSKEAMLHALEALNE